jgi:hypothetical protein
VVVLSSQAAKKEGDILLSPPKWNLADGINRKKRFNGREPFVQSICFLIETSFFTVVSYCCANTVWVVIVVAGDRRAACALNSMTSVSNTDHHGSQNGTKTALYWGVTPCRLVEEDWHFGGT